MLDKAAIQQIIPILKRDGQRALKMKVRGFPRPYYCGLLLRDITWFNTWASSGSVYRRRSDHTRNVYCDLRVGSYRYDQTTEGGLYDNDEEVESFSHVTAPIDDRHHEGLRMTLWRLIESKFKEALTDFSDKHASRVSTVDPYRRYASFTKLPEFRSVSYSRPERVHEEKWVKLCKDVSKWLSKFPHVTSNYVEFDASQETKVFVNTENRVIVQHKQLFLLTATIRKLTREGVFIEQDVVVNGTTLKDLPDIRSFKKQLRQKYKQLTNLMKSRKMHSFSGPVLLCPIPAGLMFHEAIGHRLEGSRLLSSGEGQTFKGQIGKRVLNIDLTIRDDPRRKSFKGRGCIGAYDFDDEGTPANEGLLVQDGILRGFLNTRAALPGRKAPLNGHARNKKFQRPVSRMAVTIVEAKDGVSFKELKKRLIDEIKRQNRHFGMIVYESGGGESATNSYDFQAFTGEIAYATLVYPNGKEVPVKGVDFVSTPLQALSSIIAAGDDQEMENHYCGAESGFIPVSTISPAVLLSNLELQLKEEALVTPYLLPKPRARRGKRR